MSENVMMSLELGVFDDPIGDFVREEGWKEVHNPPPRLLSKTKLILGDVVDVVGISGVAKPEHSIEGVEFLRRLRLMKADLGKEDALKIWHQKKRIPKEWNSNLLMTSYLVEDGFDSLRILYFVFGGINGDCWHWRFGSVHCKFGVCCRAIVPINYFIDS